MIELMDMSMMLRTVYMRAALNWFARSQSLILFRKFLKCDILLMTHIKWS